MVPPSHLNLTSLLDVLLIVFFSFILAAGDAMREETDELTATVDGVLSQVESLTSEADVNTGGPEADLASNRAPMGPPTARVQAAYEQIDRLREHLTQQGEVLERSAQALLRAEERITTLQADVAHCEDSLEVLLESLRQDALFGELSPAAQQALQSLMSTTITIVQLYIEDDQVSEYQRYPEGGRHRLSEPIPLTRVVASAGVTDPADYPREVLDHFFPRLTRVLDNSLAQRSPDDRVFYLMINESRNTCSALLGLTDEINRTPDLVVVAPNLGGCH